MIAGNPGEVVEKIHAHMTAQLPIDRVEVCYHSGHETPPCDCRKPRPGMLLRAAHELGIDLAQSWMVGDRWRDVDCGRGPTASRPFSTLARSNKFATMFVSMTFP